MKYGYIRQNEKGRYQVGLQSESNKNEITWSINSWKNKKTAIAKIKSSRVILVDLTK